MNTPELLGFNLKVEARQHAMEEISLGTEGPVFFHAYLNKLGNGFIRPFSPLLGWLHLASKASSRTSLGDLLWV